MTDAAAAWVADAGDSGAARRGASGWGDAACCVGHGTVWVRLLVSRNPLTMFWIHCLSLIANWPRHRCATPPREVLSSCARLTCAQNSTERCCCQNDTTRPGAGEQFCGDTRTDEEQLDCLFSKFEQCAMRAEESAMNRWMAALPSLAGAALLLAGCIGATGPAGSASPLTAPASTAPAAEAQPTAAQSDAQEESQPGSSV